MKLFLHSAMLMFCLTAFVALIVDNAFHRTIKERATLTHINDYTGPNGVPMTDLTVAVQGRPYRLTTLRSLSHQLDLGDEVWVHTARTLVRSTLLDVYALQLSEHSGVYVACSDDYARWANSREFDLFPTDLTSTMVHP